MMLLAILALHRQATRGSRIQEGAHLSQAKAPKYRLNIMIINEILAPLLRMSGRMQQSLLLLLKQIEMNQPASGQHEHEESSESKRLRVR